MFWLDRISFFTLQTWIQSSIMMTSSSEIQECGLQTQRDRQESSLRFSVIVPVYNGGLAFEACLESLKVARPAPAEIIVVDDGSTDGSADRARRAGLKVLSTPKGRSGPATARNLGAQEATGDILFFVDADCSLAPDALSHIEAIFESDPQVAAVVGSYDEEPSARNLLSQYKNLLHHYVHHNSGPTGFTFWGACGVIRREDFDAVGGFDTSYNTASIEDIDLGYRLRAAGKEIRMYPALQVKHHKCWRPKNLFHADFFLRAIPWSRLILRTGKMENSLNISRVARLRVALSGALAASSVISILFPMMLWVVGALALMLLACDWSVISWFGRKRGVGFALAVVPWHWFSHFYSGCGLLVAMFQHWMDGLQAKGLEEATDAELPAASAG